MRREQLPLNAEGFSRFHTAAHQHDDPEYRIVGQSLLHTGMRNQTLGHFHKSWYEHGPHGPQLRVPASQDCWKEDPPCFLCRNNDDEEEDEEDDDKLPHGVWGPKTSASENRVIPIPESFEDYHREERREVELPDLLDSYFGIHDYVGMSTQKVNRVVKELARDADLHELQGRGRVERNYSNTRELYPDVTPHDLRGSWACQGIRADINRFRLRDWGGWDSVDMLDNYGKFVGGGDGSQREKY